MSRAVLRRGPDPAVAQCQGCRRFISARQWSRARPLLSVTRWPIESWLVEGEIRECKHCGGNVPRLQFDVSNDNGG